MPGDNGILDRYYANVDRIQNQRDAGEQRAINEYYIRNRPRAPQTLSWTTDPASKRHAYSMQRDATQQKYDQQNMYQREAADISAKWADNIQQLRNAGYEYSEKSSHGMKVLEETFRKTVVNNPNLDEGQKQQLKVQHQRALSAFVPDEKVSNPDDEIAQTFKYSAEMGTWLKRGRDSRGNPDWDVIGSGSGQSEDKQVALKRKAFFDRQKEYDKIVSDIRTRVDGVGDPLYTDEDGEKIEELARKEFAERELLYRTEYGLPPSPAFQREADRVRNDQRDQQLRNQYQQLPREQRSQYDQGFDQGRGRQPQAAKPLPVISARSPLPREVSQRLQTQVGGKQLEQFREKHKSNSELDQTIRHSADIVIRSVLTKDESDPLLPEAIENLKRAGFKVGQ